MKSFAEHLKNCIIDPSKTLGKTNRPVGSSPTTAQALWPVFVSLEPESPNRCVTLYDTGGPGPLHTMNPNSPVTSRDTAQVRVRSNSLKEGYEKAGEIQDIIQAVGRHQNNTHIYHFIRQESNIQMIGVDEKSRYLHTINYYTLREPKTGE